MPTLRVELPTRPHQADVEALRTDIQPYGYLDEQPPVRLDLKSVALSISLVSDVLQGADVLANWLQRTPHTNKAVIHFSDGRTLRLEDNDDEAFRKALKAALKAR